MQLIISLTERCNYRCPYCYVTIQPPANSLYETEPLFNLTNILRKQELLSVSLTGGEPTLISNLSAIIRYLQDMDIHVSLLTNGSRPHIIRELRPDSCQISIDGVPEIHDKLRGAQGAFNKALKTINLCQNSQIQTSVQFTISALNYRTVDCTLNRLSNLPVSRLRVIAVHSGPYALTFNAMREVLESIERYSFNKLSMPPITTNLCRTKFIENVWSCIQLDSLPWFTDRELNYFYLLDPDLQKFRLYRDDFLNQEIRVHFVKKTLRYLMEREYSSPSTVSCLNDFT